MDHISVSELHEKLVSGETLNIIDVREPHEIEESNIGALALPLSQINNFEVDSIESLKDETIYIHCRSGMRSQQAAQILDTMGFKHLVNVDGGILAWKELYGEEKIQDICRS